MNEMQQVKAALDGFTQEVTASLSSMEGRLDEIEQVMATPRFRRAGREPIGGGGGGVDARAVRDALGTYVRTGNESEFKAALQVSSGPDGGYFVQEVLSDGMTKRIYDTSPMRRLARVVTITTGDAFVEPRDMGEVGAEWIGELSERPATSAPQIGMMIVPVDEIYAMTPISQQLLDDSKYDIGTWIEEKIGDKFGRKEGTACISGNGVKKPTGFLLLDTDTAIDGVRAETKLQHVVSGSASTVTADALRNLYWALRAAHRNDATWLMASSTANAIDKLKDGQGNYLWRDSMTAGAPPSLLGRPVEFDETMPEIASNAFPIAFADWKRGYCIADKAGVRFLRDPFTVKGQVQFYAYRRTGGNVANTDAIKLLKIST